MQTNKVIDTKTQ